MTTREIKGHLEEIYGVEVSPTLISTVTEAVMEEVKIWQNRQLDALYPIVYMDAIQVKARENGHVVNKAVYLAIGIKLDGDKEVLGMWISENEGAKFWLQVVTELHNRGVNDIFIACVDGLKGFPEAIGTVFPKTQIQTCIVHMVRNSLAYVSYKTRAEVAAGPPWDTGGRLNRAGREHDREDSYPDAVFERDLPCRRAALHCR